MDFRVLELFSGIGGMHLALRSSGVAATVVTAMDINTHANAVYAFNFPQTLVCNNNIQSLTPRKIEEMNVNMILMSPPCQPHTRVGNRLDVADNRSDALQHICNMLPQCKTIEYILMENVKGFETSLAHEKIVQALQSAGFHWREFILSPTQFGVPNVRHRYYCLARKIKFSFSGNRILEEIPEELKNLCCFEEQLISNLVEPERNIADEHYLPDKILRRHATLLDIVNTESEKTMCFTKAYTRYSEGTGSIYTYLPRSSIDSTFTEVKDLPFRNEENRTELSLELLRSLRLRYFTPREVARLMSFPDSFDFPKKITNRQRYRLLGNSINVHVVGFLIKVLCS